MGARGKKRARGIIKGGYLTMKSSTWSLQTATRGESWSPFGYHVLKGKWSCHGRDLWIPFITLPLSRRTWQLSRKTTFLLQEKQRSHPLLKTEDVGGVEDFIFWRVQHRPSVTGLLAYSNKEKKEICIFSKRRCLVVTRSRISLTSKKSMKFSSENKRHSPTERKRRQHVDPHPRVLVSNFNAKSGFSKISGECSDESGNKK